ncbi:hypothetical protein [Pararhodonellum marinum]|uniref:hypothetical protein n=1 Tax=Pararhodonellum marinum TaxID=2755358 RepID=UPI001890044F|nr:hypothetical protein [Pararhodonellum marinum]
MRDPIDAIKVRMEDLGLKAKDHIPTIGDKGTVSKVFKQKNSTFFENDPKLVPNAWYSS